MLKLSLVIIAKKLNTVIPFMCKNFKNNRIIEIDKNKSISICITA